MSGGASTGIHFKSGSKKLNSLTNIIAMATSFFAIMAALSGVMETRSHAKAFEWKSDANFLQTEVSNQWDYYQSRNIRSEIAQLGIQTLPVGSARHKKAQEKIDWLLKQKDEISAKARSFEAERDRMMMRSEEILHITYRFMTALLLFQLAIILTPMTLLVRRVVLLKMGGAVGTLGAAYFGLGIFEYLSRF